MLRFDLLRTPAQDGDVLIEPAAPTWAQLIEQNVRTRLEGGDSALTLAGTPLEEARHAIRDRLFGPDLVEPVIACGHQPEFAHPGVWAKHVVVHQVVSLLGLHGADLVVDNDAPRSSGLTLPVIQTGGVVSRQRLGVLAGTAGAAYEGRAPLSPTAIDNLQRRAAGALAGVKTPDHARLADKTLLFQYFRGLASVERPRDFVEQHLAARARIDRSLGADLQEIRVSDAFDGPFVADILLNLERFAREYNASLAAYRKEQKVRSPDRPLPDLKQEGDRLEAPFWIYQPLQQRQRLWISARADAIELFAGGQSAGVLSRADLTRNAAAALASLSPWVIRPRALTLTLWARLLVCDLFVHGIGGAKYDRINDGIFRHYYGCEPPPYACVTATLRLPLPHFAVGEQDSIAAKRRIRDLRYNPQRYVRSVPAEWLEQRQGLIERSGELHDRQGSSLERHEVFRAIRGLNERMFSLEPQLDEQFQLELEQVRKQAESNAVADSREFFYALQPRSRLEMLAARLGEAIRVPVQA